MSKASAREDMKVCEIRTGIGLQRTWKIKRKSLLLLAAAMTLLLFAAMVLLLLPA